MRKKIVSLLLTLTLFCGAALPAYADEADMAKVEGGMEISQEYADEVRAMRNGGIFDDEELEKMMEDFITAHKLKKENISIGFVYTATGDTWYYNPDTWYYPGSMYKIPLMMLLAEQVSSGMLTQDGPFEGMTVSQYEEHILTYSNNDYAHRMRKYLGEGDDKVWRKAAQAYANMPEDSYNPDYMDYSYFSARYLTEVLTTLYNGGEERFLELILRRAFRFDEHLVSTRARERSADDAAFHLLDRLPQNLRLACTIRDAVDDERRLDVACAATRLALHRHERLLAERFHRALRRKFPRFVDGLRTVRTNCREVIIEAVNFRGFEANDLKRRMSRRPPVRAHRLDI